MYNFVQKYFAQIVHFYIDNNTVEVFTSSLSSYDKNKKIL